MTLIAFNVRGFAKGVWVIKGGELLMVQAGDGTGGTIVGNRNDSMVFL